MAGHPGHERGLAQAAAARAAQYGIMSPNGTHDRILVQSVPFCDSQIVMLNRQSASIAHIGGYPVAFFQRLSYNFTANAARRAKYYYMHGCSSFRHLQLILPNVCITKSMCYPFFNCNISSSLFLIFISLLFIPCRSFHVRFRT
jgi:hypothetical protein